ncbi:MAG: hypothetical protein JO064_11890 [Actinobacteria bacterium]|nr:hypothetical protein [Actinomycetota bacterium]
MPLYAWAALVVFIIATGGGLAFAIARALNAWFTFRHFRRALGRRLGDVMRGVAGAEGRLARAGESAARLDRARIELQESIAVAQVMAASAGDARALLRGLSFLRP